MKERARGQFDHGVKSMKGGGAIGRVPNRIMDVRILFCFQTNFIIKIMRNSKVNFFSARSHMKQLDLYLL